MMRELQDGADALAQAAKTIGLEDEEINSQLRRQADRVNRGDIDSVPGWYGKVR